MTTTYDDDIDSVLPPVMWLDPGGTTGWASLVDGVFRSGQEADFQLFGNQLELQCSIHGEALHVGWEDFILNQLTATKHGSEKALEVIGLVRYIATKYECTLLPPAPPSARELGSLIKLRRLGWYRSGQPHGMDAASHLLSYLLREKWLPPHLLRKVIGDPVRTAELSVVVSVPQQKGA